MPALSGFDVSNNQGVIDWPRAAAGRAFVAIKASEGLTYNDAYFTYNWRSAAAQNLVRIAFHFARPNANSAEDEAAHFVSIVQSVLGPYDLVALDFEDELAQGDLSDWALRWLQLVTAALGFKPLFYSGIGYLQEHGILGDVRFADYGLWLAYWAAQQPAAPAPWAFIALWQSSDAGTVDGVDGPCDLDTFNGPLERLRLYGLQPVPPEPDKLPLDPPARLQLVGYVAGGSGVADLETWIGGYRDPN